MPHDMDFFNITSSRTSLSCRRQTGATHCVPPILVYTKVDAQSVINWRRSSVERNWQLLVMVDVPGRNRRVGSSLTLVRQILPPLLPPFPSPRFSPSSPSLFLLPFPSPPSTLPPSEVTTLKYS